jgi:DNA polymerase
VGNEDADIMLVGEGPGAEEDRQGEPFVGRAGQLLTAMLYAIGLQRKQVYIANIVKCRPPGNRVPAPEEIQHCAPYLHRQIELVNPRLLVALGATASRHLLQTVDSLNSLRGRVHTCQDIPLIVTYHPAYLLRVPANKRKAWDDLQAIVTLSVKT